MTTTLNFISCQAKRRVFYNVLLSMKSVSTMTIPSAKSHELVRKNTEAGYSWS